MKIIGLDVGEKRIGVAKVDSNTRIAVPVGFVTVDGSEWQEIARIARMQGSNLFVLGLPRSNEGNETKQTLYVRNFSRVLTEKIPGAKIRFQDESLTSVEAENRLKSRGKKYARGDIDAEAAAIILQDFIENFEESKDKDARKEVAKSEKAAGKGVGKTAKSAQYVQNVAENVAAGAKKEGDRIALQSKKASSKLKKWTIFGIPVVVLLILAGVTGALKYRDYVREQREEEYRRQEAEMVAEVFSFTVKPGETIYNIKDEFVKAGYSETEVEEAFSKDYSEIEGLEFLKNRPAGATLEGYIFGETREFYVGTPVDEILEVFLKGTGEIIAENNLEGRYAAKGLTLFEGITLASIVQKEAPGPEMATVAQVFLTRLSLGMSLGSDVTVSYALDMLDPSRDSHSDNETALMVDSCYNTRIYAGLPCGPISNPGLTALIAVAEPTETEYLFFLTGDDGVMYYSYTEAEHNYNAATHCLELCNVSL